MKKYGIRIITVALLSCVFLVACSDAKASPQENKTKEEESTVKKEVKNGYQKIKMEEAKQKMLEKGELVLLDVRTAEEYTAGHIPGAINIPNETISEENTTGLPENLDAEILVYCRTGVRSEEAAKKLTNMGYTNVFDIGGIQDWQYNVTTGSETGELGDIEESLFGEFTAKTLDGQDIDQTVFSQADLTMVNVWATFCGPCISEMPGLGIIHDKYKEQNFQVVGVVMDVFGMDGSVSEEQIATAKEIVEKTNAKYTHIIPTEALIMTRLKDVVAVPQTYFVDKEGNIIGETYMGARDEQQWESIIHNLLEDVKETDAEA